MLNRSALCSKKVNSCIIYCVKVERESYCSTAISNKTMHASNGNIHVNDLRFCHLNIRGDLKGKKAEIEHLLDRVKPSILGLSETNQSHLDNVDYSDTLYNFVPGYT